METYVGSQNAIDDVIFTIAKQGGKTLLLTYPVEKAFIKNAYIARIARMNRVPMPHIDYNADPLRETYTTIIYDCCSPLNPVPGRVLIMLQSPPEKGEFKSLDADHTDAITALSNPRIIDFSFSAVETSLIIFIKVLINVLVIHANNADPSLKITTDGMHTHRFTWRMECFPSCAFLAKLNELLRSVGLVIPSAILDAIDALLGDNHILAAHKKNNTLVLARMREDTAPPSKTPFVSQFSDALIVLPFTPTQSLPNACTASMFEELIANGNTYGCILRADISVMSDLHNVPIPNQVIFREKFTTIPKALELLNGRVTKGDFPAPVFELIKRYGEPHNQRFVIKLTLGQRVFISDEEKTVKAAKANAASKALARA